MVLNGSPSASSLPGSIWVTILWASITSPSSVNLLVPSLPLPPIGIYFLHFYSPPPRICHLRGNSCPPPSRTLPSYLDIACLPPPCLARRRCLLGSLLFDEHFYKIITKSQASSRAHPSPACIPCPSILQGTEIASTPPSAPPTGPTVRPRSRCIVPAASPPTIGTIDRLGQASNLIFRSLDCEFCSIGPLQPRGSIGNHGLVKISC
ncbi:hypothetical protein RJ55_07605 [Drechmeria coniospora]|nr:hypothetical protein RJ55_07605 [Drechmeria coniospora]